MAALMDDHLSCTKRSKRELLIPKTYHISSNYYHLPLHNFLLSSTVITVDFKEAKYFLKHTTVKTLALLMKSQDQRSVRRYYASGASFYRNTTRQLTHTISPRKFNFVQYEATECETFLYGILMEVPPSEIINSKNFLRSSDHILLKVTHFDWSQADYANSVKKFNSLNHQT